MRTTGMKEELSDDDFPPYQWKSISTGALVVVRSMGVFSNNSNFFGFSWLLCHVLSHCFTKLLSLVLQGLRVHLLGLTSCPILIFPKLPRSFDIRKKTCSSLFFQLPTPQYRLSCVSTWRIPNSVAWDSSSVLQLSVSLPDARGCHVGKAFPQLHLCAYLLFHVEQAVGVSFSSCFQTWLYVCLFDLSI